MEYHRDRPTRKRVEGGGTLESIAGGDKDEDGCDDNQEDMDDDENSWSPSPLIIGSAVVEDDPNLSSIKSSKPQPPVIEEENGKIKVTEQFMRDLIR